MKTLEKRWLRPKEAKEYLGIGLSTVWLYVKQGKLTPKKLSMRVTVFDRLELDALIDGAVA